MIVRYTVNATGEVISSQVEEFTIGDFDVKLNFTNHDEYETVIDSVALERELTEQETNRVKQRNQVENKPNEEMVIHTGVSDEMSNEFGKKLQTIEALGGLYGIRNLNWEFPKVELIPEPKDKLRNPQIRPYNFEDEQSVRLHRWSFDLDDFDWTLIENLRVPISFYNRGNQLLDEGDYVNAYTNFYLVLEGLYAESHKNVEEQFLQSEELVNAAESAFPDAIELIGDDLETFFEFYNKEQSPQGYLELLVVIRHQLNHFFHEDGGPHGPNPLNVGKFRELSYAIMHLTYLILLVKVNEVGFDTETEQH